MTSQRTRHRCLRCGHLTPHSTEVCKDCREADPDYLRLIGAA